MFRFSLSAGLVLAALTLAAVQPAAAATLAFDSADDAAYSGGGDFNGLNGGNGFNPFVIVNDGANTNGRFIATGSPIGSGASTKAFDLYNYAPQGVNTIDATRSFTAPLTTGSTFSADFKNLGIANGGFVGYTLRNTAGSTLFQFGFIGGTNNYFFGDGTTSTDTGLFYTSGGLHTSVTLTAPTTYSFSVQRLSDASPSVFTGTLGSSGAIDRVVFSDNFGGQDSDVQFNNLSITGPAVPEASSSIGLGVMLALGGVGLVLTARKRRHAVRG